MSKRDSSQRAIQHKFSTGSLTKESDKDRPQLVDQGSQHQLDLISESDSARKFENESEKTNGHKHPKD